MQKKCKQMQTNANKCKQMQTNANKCKRTKANAKTINQQTPAKHKNGKTIKF